MTRETVATTEVLKALSDPIRWNIVQQVAGQEEFPCSVLEDTLPVSKTTISYHTKILAQAGLIETHKRGRNYFYSLRHEVLRTVIDDLWRLSPGPRLVESPADARPAEQAGQPLLAAASGDAEGQAGLLTW